MDGPIFSRCYSIETGRALVSPFGGGRRAAVDDGFAFFRSSVRTFRRGEIIAMPGVRIDKFARVQHGLVIASTVLPDGREFIAEVIPTAGVIGELEVLRRQTLSLEYRAATDCELHFFEGRLLREKYVSDPDFQESVLLKALARVSELELRIISNAGSSLQSRLASTLLRLSKVYAKEAPNSRDELIISQHDLAATLPASREKVNRCLRRLRESKIIDGAQGRIRILNRKALQACADSTFSEK
ncbi:Crp/Fnr family transcriptional regulator [Sinorhizobium numidicum]|uniref:Crp/Fnr family transcriptional regulator n=1 Tax=Sinorhizobium numidicum TaxID=680248 RepID=A0ABY8CT12_9HYPH|nr:Crp/Fnr family transcriptional regulator [Sinorhizobium numidicum]WEX74852.1 Crp/Fnr family transcriptional regulator [Sinorhizobium numidicum]WEX81729.1 Crp/Fnr family transcriptional regulator [Sinorhizobium numidicum]